MVQDQALGMLMLAHDKRGRMKCLTQHLGVHWFVEMHIKPGSPCALFVCVLPKIAFTTNLI
jgi:hypothetical protein